MDVSTDRQMSKSYDYIESFRKRSLFSCTTNGTYRPEYHLLLQKQKQELF